jgi:hypothetical protein
MKSQLKEFGPNIWSVEGPIVKIGDFPYRTRMAVVKLAAGGAWLWSPVTFSTELAFEIETKAGPVTHIVAPNKLHHLNLKDWSEYYPKSKVYAPPGLKQRSVVADVNFTHDLGEESHISEDFSQVIFNNLYFMEEVVFFHKESSTALFCDLIQRYKPSEAEGWRGIKRRMDGLVIYPAGETKDGCCKSCGGTPREWVWSFWLGQEPVRKARNVIIEQWKPDRLLIAHGDCVQSGATGVIDKALDWAV